jgi:hypothetical protein
MWRPLGCCLVRLILPVQSHPTVARQSWVNKTSTGSLHRILVHSVSSPFLFTAPQWKLQRKQASGEWGTTTGWQPRRPPCRSAPIDGWTRRRQVTPRWRFTHARHPHRGASKTPASSHTAQAADCVFFYPHGASQMVAGGGDSSIVAATTGQSTSTVARRHHARRWWWWSQVTEHQGESPYPIRFEIRAPPSTCYTDLDLQPNHALDTNISNIGPLGAGASG